METWRGAQQPTNLVNVARYVLSHPQTLGTLIGKVLKRLQNDIPYYTEENTRWIEQHAIPPEQLARSINPELWKETQDFAREFTPRAKAVLADIPHAMGSGGAFEFLYWLTRLRKPRVVVETGVAAGWTSQAFLEALKRNGSGHLYSSDLPCFRLPDPERFVGVVVDEELKQDWTLYLDGDALNLPRILAQVNEIDLFHYDSDKSRSGREAAMRLVLPKMSKRGLIVMDDLMDNDWFKQFVTREKLPFAVLPGGVGIVGEIA